MRYRRGTRARLRDCRRRARGDQKQCRQDDSHWDSWKSEHGRRSRSAVALGSAASFRLPCHGVIWRVSFPDATIPDTRNRSLHQVLGVAFGLAVLIGNTIGVGILRTAGDIAARLPSPGWFVAVFAIGGVYALLGAMSLAEPGAMIQRSGGQYPIVHRALGPYPGFVVGWSDWLSTSASTALAAIVFAEYALPLVPGFPGGATAMASVLVFLFGVLQWRGVKTGDVAQQLLSAGKALAFSALVVACFVLAVPDRAAVTPATLPAGSAFIAALVLALQSVIYTYDGWTAPLYFGEETVDAGRSVPRSMVIGVLAVIAIYVLLSVGQLRVLGVGAMAGDPFTAASTGSALFGARGDLIIRLIVLCSILGALNALVMMQSRIPLAMSRDLLMPPWFGAVNAGGTPTVAHWTSIGIAIGFIVTGTFNSVLALAAFFFVANYCISFSAVFALRRKEPDTPRPYRVPGFPYTTGLVLFGSVAFLIGAVLSDRANSLRSILLLAASYPVYALFVRKRLSPA
ncbi:MAG: APC family permease [Gemmatimonadota bacterium]